MSDLQRRTEALLRSRGYLTASVERRKRFPDPKSKKCQACGSVRMLDIASDLWNVFDLIGIRPSFSIMTGKNCSIADMIFVQVTDSTSHSKRRNKIIASGEAKLCILAGARVLIQSWKKVDNRYQSHDEWITLDQFAVGLADTAEQFYEDQARLKLLDRKAKLPALPPGSTLPLSPELSKRLPFERSIMEITLGRIVLYTLTEQDAVEINRRRTTGSKIAERIKLNAWPLGAQAHIGNEVKAGDVYPLIVTKVWSAGCVNGQVLLDGNDCLWATSATEGTQGHQWQVAS